MQVLAINPGSTSTKIALFENEDLVWKEMVEHPADRMLGYGRVSDQYLFRLDAILDVLEHRGCRIDRLGAIVARGGLLKPLAGGTYLVDSHLVEELRNATEGEHASNLGGIIAYYLAMRANINAYIVDPVSVDEMEPWARLSGLPELARMSQSHALNMKAVGRKVAREAGADYSGVNLVVAHLGSGISVAAHRRGKMIDVNNANNEGPFSPERCGTLPAVGLARLCYSGKYSEEKMLAKILKEGGMYAYLGTKDAREAEERMTAGDGQAKLVLEACSYQIAKEIGAMAAVLAGDVDWVILTGGLAKSAFITGNIMNRVRFIAPVVVVPGEEEMESLVLGALRVLNNEEPALVYQT